MEVQMFTCGINPYVVDITISMKIVAELKRLRNIVEPYSRFKLLKKIKEPCEKAGWYVRNNSERLTIGKHIKHKYRSSVRPITFGENYWYCGDDYKNGKAKSVLDVISFIDAEIERYSDRRKVFISAYKLNDFIEGCFDNEMTPDEFQKTKYKLATCLLQAANLISSLKPDGAEALIGWSEEELEKKVSNSN